MSFRGYIVRVSGATGVLFYFQVYQIGGHGESEDSPWPPINSETYVTASLFDGEKLSYVRY